MTWIKPKFWDQKIGLLSILLLPLSFIVIFIIFVKKNFTRKISCKIPIICVGNIYIGGTGKTPISIYLADELSRLGKKAAILRKYYKSHSDEYGLIKESFNNLIINQNRAEGVKEAENSGNEIVILDDGLQDYAIKKDLKIVCFNRNQLIGNGLILPSGPLRERLSSLIDAEIVIINGKKEKNFEEKILKINKNLEIFYSSYKAINIDEFKSKKLLALAGIGNPENFFRLLEENNLMIDKKLVFADHYSFSKEEIQNIINEADKNNQQIIMTEKDYFKIKNFNLKKIKYLKVMTVIDKKEKFIERVKKIL
tara:strand:- start:1052 stop:1981 length:930 start_codon:yes stop_codon:yes gene_type:complete